LLSDLKVSQVWDKTLKGPDSRASGLNC